MEYCKDLRSDFSLMAQRIMALMVGEEALELASCHP